MSVAEMKPVPDTVPDIKGVSLEAAQALGFRIRRDLADEGWVSAINDDGKKVEYWVAYKGDDIKNTINFNPVSHLQSLALIENHLMERNMSEFKTTVLDDRLLLNYTYPDTVSSSPVGGTFKSAPQAREILAATHVTERFEDHDGNKWRARAFAMARLVIEVHRRPRW